MNRNARVFQFHSAIEQRRRRDAEKAARKARETHEQETADLRERMERAVAALESYVAEGQNLLASAGTAQQAASQALHEARQKPAETIRELVREKTVVPKGSTVHPKYSLRVRKEEGSNEYFIDLLDAKGAVVSTERLPIEQPGMGEHIIRMRHRKVEIQPGDQTIKVRRVTTDTVMETEDGIVEVDTTAGDVTVTMMDGATIFTAGRSMVYRVKKVNLGGGDVIIEPASGTGQTIEGQPDCITLGGEYPEVGLYYDGSISWWIGG